MSKTIADFDMGSQAGFFIGDNYYHGTVTNRTVTDQKIRITMFHTDANQNPLRGMPARHNWISAREAYNHA